MVATRELRRAVRELGFRGLRILPWLWNLPPDDARFYPLYAEVCGFRLQASRARERYLSPQRLKRWIPAVSVLGSCARVGTARTTD